MVISKILIHIKTNGCGNQAFLWGLDFEVVPFKKAINMFKTMDIAESFHEGVVKPSY